MARVELSRQLTAMPSQVLISNTRPVFDGVIGLTVHKKGKLATLDQRIPADAVRGGKQALELIPV
ncbi:MAG: hypothetical protein HY675_08695 [Chloroflexi bacterium]|nr:hypothetical protein [Chloroflexota bacterium]